MFSAASSRTCFSCLSHSSTAGVLASPFFQCIVGLYPMISSNGVFFVVSFVHWLCANLACGSHVIQSFCVSLQKLRRYCSSHWFVRSDCPSVCGWKAVDIFCCMPSVLHKSLANFDVNLVSLSEIIFFGSPNRLYTCLRYNRATPSAVISSIQGINIAALEQS